MRLRCNKLFIFAIFPTASAVLHSSDRVFAQEVEQIAPAQVAPAQVVVVQDFNLAAPLQFIQGNMVQEPRSNSAQRWVRGVIQSELNSIESLCKPTSEQKQQLLDLAEKQWKVRLVTTIKAYAEAQNQRIPVDFEYRVERLVATWVSDILSEEQAAVWRKELEGRLDLRRRVVIGRMVADVESKLGLTAEQMEKVAEILKERWKDTWWSMYRAGTLPETKFAWISGVLSESQRTAGIDRSSQMLQQHFVQGATVDLPSKSLNERFELGGTRSDEGIPLHLPEPEREAPDGAMIAVPAMPAVRPGGDDDL